MANARMVRDFTTPADPWPIVEHWAAGQGYRCIASGPTRTYRKGTGLAVGARMLLVSVTAGWVHLEAWVAANGLARFFSLGLLPREITVDPGGVMAVLPRKMGQAEVDGLLAAFGQPSVVQGGVATAIGTAPAWNAAPTPMATPVGATAGPSAGTPPPAPLPVLQPLPPAPPPGLAYQPAGKASAPAGPWYRRWPARLAAVLLLVGAIAVGVLGTSSPSIEDRNQAASGGESYLAPKGLVDSVVAGGVSCTNFVKGDPMPGAVGTIIARSGDCTVGGQGVTATVFARGPIMQDLKDGFVTSWLGSMRDFEGSPLILVGPNWTVWATDDEVLFDVQDAIGGTLQE